MEQLSNKIKKGLEQIYSYINEDIQDFEISVEGIHSYQGIIDKVNNSVNQFKNNIKIISNNIEAIIGDVERLFKLRGRRDDAIIDHLTEAKAIMLMVINLIEQSQLRFGDVVNQCPEFSNTINPKSLGIQDVNPGCTRAIEKLWELGSDYITQEQAAGKFQQHIKQAYERL